MQKLKPKKCRICSGSFIPTNSLVPVCSPECAIILVRKKAEVKKKKEAALNNKLQQIEQKLKKAAFDEKFKKLSEYEAEAKRQFQLFCRLRDHALPCISCGTKHSDYWDGGHYLKAELFSGTIFYEHNVNKQCRKCNFFIGGNEFNYRIGLVEKIGLQAVEELEAEALKKRYYKWTKDELIEIRQIYSKKCRELKKVIEK